MNTKTLAETTGITDEKETKLLERIVSNQRIVCLHALDQGLTDSLCNIIRTLASRSKAETAEKQNTCGCGHGEYGHTDRECKNGGGHGNHCACRDFQKEEN